MNETLLTFAPENILCPALWRMREATHVAVSSSYQLTIKMIKNFSSESNKSLETPFPSHPIPSGSGAIEGRKEYVKYLIRRGKEEFIELSNGIENCPQAAST